MAPNPSKLEVRSINGLLEERFFVPSYQRGYRWTTIQVTELLDDIWEFHNKENKLKEEFYCLQPIVVKKINQEWELIDGQQRLTTIFLILQFLKSVLTLLDKKSYSIKYQTRKESESFLQNIDIGLKSQNIDFYHFCNAYNAIENWFNLKDGTDKVHFITTLLNNDETGRNVKVIWYEVDSEASPIDIFTRINLGKIPLSNAELIKALFLRKDNFPQEEIKKVYLKQLQIASEWDFIESTLQQESFWHFIFEGENTYQTRIEYIFDLMQNKKEDDEEYFTFHKFSESLGKVTDISYHWLKIKNFFQTFNDWYKSNQLYHLIGYLIASKHPILELINKSIKMSKTEFRSYIISLIKNRLNFDIDDLEYRDKHVRSLLLLFNIQTILINSNSDIRFPFDRYKKEKWDVEHIRSVKSDKPLGSKQKLWLENVLEYFTGTAKLENQAYFIEKLEGPEKKIAQKIHYLIQSQKISDSEFTILYNEILQFFKEDIENENINSISNLALLDAGTNRSYKNAVFPVKRKIILQNESKGDFVPICTKNVFLKAYSNKVKNVMFWQVDDENDYIKAIKGTLAVYLNSHNYNEAHA